MDTLIWASAAIITSVAFFLIFRRPLSDLMDRTRSVSRDGLQISDGNDRTPPAGIEALHRELESRLYAANEKQVADLNAKLVEAQQSTEAVKAELLRFQSNIGYKKGLL